MNPCSETRPMIMSYLDGQLSEAQAAPLRKHLLECQPCRGSAQDQKNLSRWFTAAKATEQRLPVPRDFAARVARRAFQGDQGTLVREDAVLAGAPGDRTLALYAPGRHLRFVMTLTAVAAALVLFLSVAIRQSMLPQGSQMHADQRNDVLPLDETVRRLDQLNARDRAAGEEPATKAPEPAGGRRP